MNLLRIEIQPAIATRYLGCLIIFNSLTVINYKKMLLHPTKILMQLLVNKINVQSTVVHAYYVI